MNVLALQPEAPQLSRVNIPVSGLFLFLVRFLSNKPSWKGGGMEVEKEKEEEKEGNERGAQREQNRH